jgi:hypothetical protein
MGGAAGCFDIEARTRHAWNRNIAGSLHGAAAATREGNDGQHGLHEVVLLPPSLSKILPWR